MAEDKDLDEGVFWDERDWVKPDLSQTEKETEGLISRPFKGAMGWSGRYPKAERGFQVEHSTLNRWVVQYAPLLEKAFHKKKKQAVDRWRLDETYIKVKRDVRPFPRKVHSISVGLILHGL